MLRFLLIVGAMGAAGGVVGYMGIFCPDGGCAITGSWWGGASLGGLIGFALAEGFKGRGPASAG